MGAKEPSFETPRQPSVSRSRAGFFLVKTVPDGRVETRPYTIYKARPMNPISPVTTTFIGPFYSAGTAIETCRKSSLSPFLFPSQIAAGDPSTFLRKEKTSKLGSMIGTELRTLRLAIAQRRSQFHVGSIR